MEKIGEGVYANVWKCQFRHGVQALKISKGLETKKSFRREAVMYLMLADGPGILDLKAFHFGARCASLLMDYIPDTLESLSNRVHIRAVMFQLLTAIAWIHQCKIIHADLKPSNILIQKNSNQLFIIDFSISGFDDEELDVPIQTAVYRAPEVWQCLRKQSKFPPNVDIWSCGIILLELLSGDEIPASCCRSFQLYRHAVKKRLSDLKTCKDQEMVTLCNKMLEENTQERPSALSLLQAPGLVECSVASPLLVKSRKRSLTKSR